MSSKDTAKTKEECKEDLSEYTPEDSCGIGPCTPKPLQSFNNMLSFVLFFGIAAFSTQTLDSYIKSQITAIERQFKMDSKTTGIILSCNDIGFLCTVLFSSHFGKNSHIPRILSVAGVLFGVSGIMSSLCYFVMPFHLPKFSSGFQNMSSNSLSSPLCHPGEAPAPESCDQDNGDNAGGYNGVIWMLGVSMVLQGIAKSPRSSLSTAYIDNNNPVKARTAMYLGIVMTLTLFGPAIAMLLGGVFRKIPVDLQDTVLTPTHPKWVGAWWLGFFVFGCLGLITALPLVFFPRRMVSKQQTAEHSDVTERPLSEKLKDLPKSLLRILKCQVYLLTLIAMLVLMFTFGGASAFTSKYIEKQFMVPGYKTNMILGAQFIISSSIGTLLGGYLTTRFRLTRLGCFRVVLTAMTITICCHGVEFILGCETPHIRGYHDLSSRTLNEGACLCDNKEYFPVCADNSSIFFSPCFAGCTNQSQSGFSGCMNTVSGVATAGMCETDCPYLYYYIAVDMLQKLIGTICITPVYMILIRSVTDEDKAMSIGLLSFLVSLLAFLPSPILFGHIIDKSCLFWEESCGLRGTCAQYDLRQLRWWLKSSEIIGKSISLVFLVVAFLVLKRTGSTEEIEMSVQDPKASKTESTKF